MERLQPDFTSGYKRCCVDLLNQLTDYSAVYHGKKVKFTKAQITFVSELLRKTHENAVDCIDYGGYLPYCYHNHKSFGGDTNEES